ncbi:hypothetical protein ONS96_014932 [Cadophora gregata f. sp. sojae]|nr:hypothetical protein ONS96_014932 [Cadophora gregata f. sp. sojae]
MIWISERPASFNTPFPQLAEAVPGRRHTIDYPRTAGSVRHPSVNEPCNECFACIFTHLARASKYFEVLTSTQLLHGHIECESSNCMPEPLVYIPYSLHHITDFLRNNVPTQILAFMSSDLVQICVSMTRNG